MDSPVRETLELEVRFLKFESARLSPGTILDEAVRLFDEGLDPLAVDVSRPLRPHGRAAPAGRDEEVPLVERTQFTVLDDTGEGWTHGQLAYAIATRR